MISAALDLISEKGIKGLTLREIARRANVSHSAPYRHFKDKEAILHAVAKEGFDMLVTETRKRFEMFPDDPLARYLESGMAYIDFAISHQSHFRVMFGLGENRSSAPPDLKAASKSSFMILFDSIVKCQEEKLVKPGDPMEMATASWSIVHGYSMLFIEGYMKTFDALAREKLKNTIFAQLYYGLCNEEKELVHEFFKKG